LLVLCFLLVVPYWMAKKTGKKTPAQATPGAGKQATAGTAAASAATKSTAVKTPTATAEPPASAVPTGNPDRFGLTFGHGVLPNATNGLMYSACAGAPLDLANPDKNQCNPSQGDTSCRTALPVLCALKDGSTAESAGLVNEPKAEGSATGPNFYAGWMDGSLAATAPVAGFVIGSLAQANARCASELGAGWRMAEFHDAGGGWGLVGKRGQGLVNTNTRHWVAINGQKSNCWDPS
jgi:hypothetical protein